MKKRLKALMQRPENQVCSDCPEKRPTWASLIVPPPGAPPGTEKIGVFCCLECSGSHRRLGVHISFVRSVNLDSWKEWEVRAMENGGNNKVNAIFEAKLAQSGRKKPTQHADGPTRERYIRDKYERRKFYDPAAFSGITNHAPEAPPARSSTRGGGGSSPAPRPGAPSDAARRRVASRQAKMKVRMPAVAAAPAPPVAAPPPVSAPAEDFDLLDFGAFSSAPAPAAPVAAPVPAGSGVVPSVAGPAATPPSAAATPAREAATTPNPATSNDDIMALFAPAKQQQQQNQQPSGFGMQAMNQMGQGGNNGTMNGMVPQQQQQQQKQGFNSNNNQQNMMAQQQQRMMMMMMQNNNSSNNNNINMMANGNQLMQQQMMQQQMMMQKQQMMMMQQQQQQRQMPNQFQSNNTGGMNHNNGMGMNMYNASGNNGMNNFNNNNNNMNATIQGMQNMNLGMGNTSHDDGGFGTPMGGSSQQQQQTMKQDAFSSLGGMNTFR